MIINTKKIRQGFIITAICLLPYYSIAQQVQTPMINNQPISIDADNQQIDIQKDTVTFSGNVVVTQANMKVKANTLTISQFQSSDHQVITADGSPVYFEQIVKDFPEKNITGKAKQLIYNVKTSEITLLGDAQIIKHDNKILGNKITYDITDQKINAESSQGSRVKTIIIPNQVKR